MDGKPLYEYAREGLALPRPIEPRSVTVHSLEIESWLGSDHKYQWPKKSIDAEAKTALQNALRSVEENVDLSDTAEPTGPEETPAAFVLKMTVTGGTYVRSIVHDLSHSLSSAGHVVTLSRTRQGRYVTEAPSEDGDLECIPWEVFTEALENPGEVDDEGFFEWERQVQEKLELVDIPSKFISLPVSFPFDPTLLDQ